MLEAWHAGKLSRQFFRLTSEFVVAFEFRGPQPGHPSNYASIKIVAAPAGEFSLASTAIYPPSLPAAYTELLLLAVARAAVDELFAADWYPYRGCSLAVQAVGWDEVMSSEFAVYRASRGALSVLRQQGQWVLVS
jgi:hypothetical protein